MRILRSCEISQKPALAFYKRWRVSSPRRFDTTPTVTFLKEPRAFAPQTWPEDLDGFSGRTWVKMNVTLPSHGSCSALEMLCAGVSHPCCRVEPRHGFVIPHLHLRRYILSIAQMSAPFLDSPPCCSLPNRPPVGLELEHRGERDSVGIFLTFARH